MRSREEIIQDFVRQWLAKAETDLAAAGILWEAAPADYYPCAFHCQQAAEKFIKAYLVCQQVEFRKTHDLEYLLALAVQVEPGIEATLISSTWLTPFGVEFRYPGEYPEVDRATAQKALAEARHVRRVITERLAPCLSSQVGSKEG